MGATEELARFVYELEFDQIPEEALSWAKDAILDCAGVALAGAREDAARIIINYVKEAGGRPEASVFAEDFKTSAANAALANGVMAHALDYDDYVIPNWTGHPTAPMLPAILHWATAKNVGQGSPARPISLASKLVERSGLASGGGITNLGGIPQPPLVPWGQQRHAARY